nr:hypothetical protein [Streptomyces adustus]
MTATAVAAVAFLAYQASSTVPAGFDATADVSAPPKAAVKAPRDRRKPTALPGNSGTGERVVYSVDDDRVWLVGGSGRVERTFAVTPGSVDPLPGSYFVTSRSKAVTGTDGTPIEHVVRFADVGDVVIGFSAAVEPPEDPSDTTVKTGGIRESRKDGDAMWVFATIGQKIVVIR